MKTLYIVLIALLLAGCGLSSEQIVETAVVALAQTQTAAPTLTPTLTPTATSTIVPTLTPTATATLVPVCRPGNVVQGAIDSNLLGYINILKVTTSLNGENLTVIFHLRELPDEITINRGSRVGTPEIAWGVAIDVDNNVDTGFSTYLGNLGYGYDSILQAFNFKQGDEITGSIENLFSYGTFVWTYSADASISTGASGDIQVDQDEKTITISGDIPGIGDDSYLHFFSYYFSLSEPINQLCQRN